MSMRLYKTKVKLVVECEDLYLEENGEEARDSAIRMLAESMRDWRYKDYRDETQIEVRPAVREDVEEWEKENSGLTVTEQCGLDDVKISLEEALGEKED